jgi:adenylate cyclase
MAKAGVESWLAAILSVDVAEDSHLMDVGAEGAVAVLHAYPREPIEPIEPKIAAHRGRIVKSTGDG